MATIDPTDATKQLSEFFILRIFSAVKPKMMAQFMNAITWQAAWLRHFFKWDRLVVGYALTDIPERVLEVYAIPETDKAVVERTLQRLHEQKEYQELKQYCRGPREEEEQLLPGMEYKTLLRDFEIQRKQALEQLRKRSSDFESAEQALVDQDKKLADASARKAELDTQKNAQETLVKNLNEEIASLEAGAATASASTQVRLAEKRLQRAAEQAKLDNTRLLLKQLAETQGVLQEQRLDMEALVKQHQKEFEEAQFQVARKRKFEGLRIPAYFLNVTIKVKPKNLPQYIEAMKKLSEDFRWDFIAAGRPPPPEGGIWPKKPLPVDQTPKLGENEIMHLWKFGDANELYQQMVELRENPQFSVIAKLTARESQMLMCDWEALSKTKRLPGTRSNP